MGRACHERAYRPDSGQADRRVEWWRRRESNLTRFSETGLFLHFSRRSRPRNTRVPLNTRSIAPNQPQQDVEFSGRFAAPDPG